MYISKGTSLSAPSPPLQPPFLSPPVRPSPFAILRISLKGSLHSTGGYYLSIWFFHILGQKIYGTLPRSLRLRSPLFSPFCCALSLSHLPSFSLLVSMTFSFDLISMCLFCSQKHPLFHRRLMDFFRSFICLFCLLFVVSGSSVCHSS
jgi:hypothetical protein